MLQRSAEKLRLPSRLQNRHKMKTLTIIFLIYGAVVAIKSRKNSNEEPKNNVIFERLEYQVLNRTLIKERYVEVRLIARNVIKVNASVELTEPVNRFWLHATLFYKYTIYQKYLIEVHDEVCQYLNVSVPFNALAQLAAWNVLEFIDDTNIEFEIVCPFNGVLTVSNDGLNLSRLITPLLPAGRYRVDAALSRRKTSPPFATAQLYVRISDFRIWF